MATADSKKVEMLTKELRSLEAERDAAHGRIIELEAVEAEAAERMEPVDARSVRGAVARVARDADELRDLHRSVAVLDRQIELMRRAVAAERDRLSMAQIAALRPRETREMEALVTAIGGASLALRDVLDTKSEMWRLGGHSRTVIPLGLEHALADALCVWRMAGSSGDGGSLAPRQVKR